MNVYFTGSISAKDKFIHEYENIVSHVKTKGHTIWADHILKASEAEVHQTSKDEQLAFQAKVENWIKNCDCMIADTAFPSVSVGYEIALALRLGKAILVFYGENPPSLLAYYKDEKLIAEKYTDQTYKATLDDFLTYVDNKSDIRFTFFITPEIAAFLDDIVIKEKTPKAVFIRKLIEREMRARGE